MALTETPAAPEPAAPARRRSASTRLRLWVGGGAIALGIGVVLFQGLGDATVYFRTVDEAIADAPTLGDRRFRVLGAVVPGSVHEEADGVAFRIEHQGEELAVLHQGDPPELFRPGIQVVLEGHLAGPHRFESDRIMVKHSAEYREANPDRVGSDAP